MKYDEAKDFLKIIERRPLPSLIIFSLWLLPTIIGRWVELLPGNLNYAVIALVVVVWFGAVYYQWRDIRAWRRKTRLINYLKRGGKQSYRSFRHLTQEWDAKYDYSESVLRYLISRFPDELKDVPMKGKGPGVGLVRSEKEE